MTVLRSLSTVVACGVLGLSAVAAHADMVITFDYSLDTSNFFTADKRQVLDQVASIFETNLGNHRRPLNNMTLNLPDFSQDIGGGASVTYAGTSVFETNQSFAADAVRIYVGATDLYGGTVGLARMHTLIAIGGDQFVGWGGAMLFDTGFAGSGWDDYYDLLGRPNPYAGQTLARSWYVDADIRTTEPQQTTRLPTFPGEDSGYWLMQQSDFATVAMHEMGHIFGLEHSANPDDNMAASAGDRQLFTANDWLAMERRRWQVNSLDPGIPAPDIAPLEDNRVPEPGAPVLALTALMAAGWAARRRAS